MCIVAWFQRSWLERMGEEGVDLDIREGIEGCRINKYVNVYDIEMKGVVFCLVCSAGVKCGHYFQKQYFHCQ